MNERAIEAAAIAICKRDGVKRQCKPEAMKECLCTIDARLALTAAAPYLEAARDMLAALKIAHNDLTLNDSAARIVEMAIAKAEATT